MYIKNTRLANFANPYAQLLTPDSFTALQSRLRLESAPGRYVVEKTTPTDSIIGQARLLAHNTGTAFNELTGGIGAELNRRISNPLRDQSLINSKLGEEGMKDYYRKRYIGLPSAALGAGFLGGIPVIGGEVANIAADNFDYVYDHGFDKYLRDNGVNLGVLKIAETLGNTGERLKLDALERGPDPARINKLGHNVLRGTAAGATGLGIGGYTIGRKIKEKQKDNASFSFMGMASNIDQADELTAEIERITREQKQRFGATGRRIGSVLGAGIAAIPGWNIIHNSDLPLSDRIKLSGAIEIPGAVAGNIVGETVGKTITEPYYRTKAKIYGVDSIKKKTTVKKQESYPRIEPTDLARNIGTVGLASLGTGMGIGLSIPAEDREN